MANSFDAESIKRCYSGWWENPKDIGNVVFERLNEYIRERIPQGSGKKALDIGSGHGKIGHQTLPINIKESQGKT